jgi:hypothetical protein
MNAHLEFGLKFSDDKCLSKANVDNIKTLAHTHMHLHAHACAHVESSSNSSLFAYVSAYLIKRRLSIVPNYCKLQYGVEIRARLERSFIDKTGWDSIPQPDD